MIFSKVYPNTRIIFMILIIMLTSSIHSQNVEMDLATSDSTSSFKITNPLSEDLMQIGGNGSVNIGGNQFGDALYVRGKDIFHNVPNALNNGNIILMSSDDHTAITEIKYGASLNLFSGKVGGCVELAAGSDYRMNGLGGDINIASGMSGSYGQSGSVNIIAGGYSYENTGGSINIIAGEGRPGGNILIEAGKGNGDGTGIAGTLSLSGGDNDAYAGGDVIITGGQGISEGGSISISSGQTLEFPNNQCSILLQSDGVGGGDIEITVGSNYSGSNGLLILNGSGTYSGTWTQASDRRLKKNIQSLNEQSDKVLKLNPVIYEMRKDEYPEKNLANGEQIGLIAQEVEKLFPQLVRTDADGFKSIDYTKVSVLLLDVVKEQNEQLEKQNKLLEEFDKRLNKIENSTNLSMN